MLESLSFVNGQAGWELAETKFNPGLTLLVGGSGAGKTSILRAIHSLRIAAIGSDSTVAPAVWNSVFRLRASGIRVSWNGRTLHDSSSSTSGENRASGASFPAEEVWSGGLLIAKRAGSGVDLLDKSSSKMVDYPGISDGLSILLLMPRYPGIRQASEAVFSISVVDTTTSDSPESISQSRFAEESEKYAAFEALRRSPISLPLKLAIMLNSFQERARTLMDWFQEIFPIVTEIRTVPVLTRHGAERRFSFRHQPGSTWIDMAEISSGMWKSLLHLAMIELLPDDSVVLIDEFENGMGVNCLDAVTEHLLEASKRLQFIVTSHHPYVINNIPYENWRVVRREGPRIYTQTAAEAGIDAKSRHSRFIQLINSPAFGDAA